MKKVNRQAQELRPEYKRSDFGKLVRGKYAARVSAESNVVILDPLVAKAFPNDKAVNDGLRILLEVKEANARLTAGSTRRPRRRRTVPAEGTG